MIAGGRFVHNSAFGNTGVPRVAANSAGVTRWRLFSGTRLRFSYATGFMEPALYQTFAGPPYSRAQPRLAAGAHTSSSKRASSRICLRGRWALTPPTFNNLFHDQIEYWHRSGDGLGQFFNVQQSFAQGAEVELQGRIWKRLSLNTAYTYTSTANSASSALHSGKFLRSCV